MGLFLIVALTEESAAKLKRGQLNVCTEPVFVNVYGA
jgi:hypothetical protein